ncbi:hypothetical protein ACFYN0_00780 [Streptomyces sp. NPDC006704]|uniref:hypothetical protein n=1 Tax=Streptomyces sp. NPDC006704 TaxID=3364760 RepID=UPI0036AB7489
MTTPAETVDAPVEPELDVVSVFDIRRADSDVDGFVTQILGLLTSGVTLIDISQHDHRGTAIELRGRSGEAPRV